MSDLTLPGTIPKLLRRCSPVIKDGWTGAVVAKVRDLSVVVVSEDGPSWPFAQPASLRLDLTDATGRAHAAWWLAGGTDVYWMFCGLSHPADKSFGWQICGTGGHRALYAAVDLPWQGAYVPSLADLDPNDDTRLPDGSRRIDAEALRRVVLHVAGVSA